MYQIAGARGDLSTNHQKCSSAGPAWASGSRDPVSGTDGWWLCPGGFVGVLKICYVVAHGT